MYSIPSFKFTNGFRDSSAIDLVWVALGGLDEIRFEYAEISFVMVENKPET